MALRQKLFTSQKVTILAGGKEYKTQCLVSKYGAKYVFDEDELPDSLKRDGERIVDLVYKGLLVKGVLVKEVGQSGAVYNLRFMNPGLALMQQIQADILDSGLPSPWKRSLPRLDAQVRDLPVPSIAVLFHRGQSIFLTVKNFTVGGLLVDYAGDELKNCHVGTSLEFDLVTNQGDKIGDLKAVIARVTEEPGEGSSLRMQLGLKFLPMGILSDAKYRNLIRDHVVGLQKLAAKAAKAA